MFSLPALMNTAGLAADAVAGYFGINFGDPDNGDDELQKAMEIGAITALWFRAPHAASNLFSQKLRNRLSKYTGGLISNERPENFRSLLSQFKSDKVVGKMVGDSYGKFEDEEHIGLFFDAFAKAGVDVK